MRLSPTESEVLQELGLNARISLSDIANNIGKTKQVVSYNLNQLERKQIILGYYAITNIYAIGKTHYRVFLRLQKTDPTIEQTFLSFLNSHPKIVWTAEFIGELDLAFLVWADTVQEFECVLREVYQQFGQFIYKKEFSIATKITYCTYDFEGNHQNRKVNIVGGNTITTYDIDSTDKHILEHLNKRGRDAYTTIAKQLSISAATVQNRIEKMIEKNIIVGFHYKLNHRLLDLTHRKIRLVLDDHTETTYNELQEFLITQPEVIYTVNVIGEYDFEFEVLTRSDEVYQLLMNSFKHTFKDKIKTYSTLIHHHESKSGQLTEF